MVGILPPVKSVEMPNADLTATSLTDTPHSARARCGCGQLAAASLLALLGRWEGPSGTRPRDSFRNWFGFHYVDEGTDQFVSRSLPPEAEENLTDARYNVKKKFAITADVSF